MGTNKQKFLDADAAKGYADWQASWKRERDHSISEKQALLAIAKSGLDYLRLLQAKLVQELEDLAKAKPPVLAVPDLGKPYPPGCGPLVKTE